MQAHKSLRSFTVDQLMTVEIIMTTTIPTQLSILVSF